jgi:hypothetical protein
MILFLCTIFARPGRQARDGAALYVYKPGSACKPDMQWRGPSAVRLCTLLLTAVALMASRASVPAGPDSEQGRAATRTLTRFVCAKCSATGQLSSRGLFLSRVAVHRHIAASRPCSAAKMGIREIQVDVRTSDVLAGAGGAAGSAPVVRHQPEGTVRRECRIECLCTL